MEDLHPLVRAILRGLLESPLYSLAEDVVARLSSDQDEPSEGWSADDAPPRREGPALKSRRQPTDYDGMGQLLVLEEVVGGWLTREMAIARAMPKLARVLELETVSFDRFSDVNLIDEDRSVALEMFEKRFRFVVARARAALSGDAGDLP